MDNRVSTQCVIIFLILILELWVEYMEVGRNILMFDIGMLLVVCDTL